MDLNRQSFIVEVRSGLFLASGGTATTRSEAEAGRFVGATAGELALEWSAQCPWVRLVPVWDWAQKMRAGVRIGRESGHGPTENAEGTQGMRVPGPVVDRPVEGTDCTKGGPEA